MIYWAIATTAGTSAGASTYVPWPYDDNASGAAGVRVPRVPPPTTNGPGVGLALPLVPDGDATR